MKSIGDTLDRWSIVKLKLERIGNQFNDEFHVLEFEIIKIENNYQDFDIRQWCQMMYDINEKIWNLESGLRSGKEELKNEHYIFDAENSGVLSKIGMIAVMVRDYNRLRISFKNIVNKLTSGYQEIKKDHLSV